MSKALPIIVAAVLGGAALVPVYYATQHPDEFKTSKSQSALKFDAEKSTAIQQISYAFGYEVTSQMTPPELDVSAFNAGAYDGHNKLGSQLTPEQVQTAYQAFVAEQKSKQASASQPVATKTQQLTADQSFLADNAKKPNVKTTASGLQYVVDKEGTGKQPAASDTVKVNYEGKLISGEVFDSSFERGQPIEFALNQVIPGWTEGLQLMKEGSEYTFFIPSNLAYGEQGQGPIPGNSTLIFKVQLIAVK